MCLVVMALSDQRSTVTPSLGCTKLSTLRLHQAFDVLCPFFQQASLQVELLAVRMPAVTDPVPE